MEKEAEWDDVKSACVPHDCRSSDASKLEHCLFAHPRFGFHMLDAYRCYVDLEGKGRGCLASQQHTQPSSQVTILCLPSNGPECVPRQPQAAHDLGSACCELLTTTTTTTMPPLPPLPPHVLFFSGLHLVFYTNARSRTTHPSTTPRRVIASECDQPKINERVPAAQFASETTHSAAAATHPPLGGLSELLGRGTATNPSASCTYIMLVNAVRPSPLYVGTRLYVGHPRIRPVYDTAGREGSLCALLLRHGSA